MAILIEAAAFRRSCAIISRSAYSVATVLPALHHFGYYRHYTLITWLPDVAALISHC
jgi:hypothetical protein